jgi:TonB family protein
MKKISVLFVVVCLFSISLFAQTNDFSGTWKLDKEKSKLDERQAKSIESQTLTVSQTATEFKVDVKTKRMPPPEGQGGQMPNGMGQGGGRGQGGMGGGMRGGFGGGMDGTTTYEIDKETTMDQETPMGSVPVSLKSKFDKGVLKLSRSSTFSSPMGEITMTTKEEWSLSDDGFYLTVKREVISPRGSNSSEAVYMKAPVAVSIGSNQIGGNSDAMIPKIISGGVVNGKAIILPKPEFSPAAVAVGASGAVTVEVIIDEAGNVISAKSASGHPLLRASCEEAAKKAQFSPTILSGQPVKVKGVLVYNFVAEKKQQ